MTISSLVYLMVFMPMAGAFVSYLIGRRSKNARNIFVTSPSPQFVFDKYYKNYDKQIDKYFEEGKRFFNN